MKKWMICLFGCLLLVGCNETKEPLDNLHGSVQTYPNSFKTEADEFLYELQVNKNSFSKEEKIDITASLTYIGNKDEIVISHASSPFYFDIKETTRGYDIEYPMDQPLISTTLKNEEPLKIQYVPSGGYSDLDAEAYRSFIDEFLSEGYPVGNYVVHGYVQFTVEGEQHETELGGNIGFQVNWSIIYFV